MQRTVYSVHIIRELKCRSFHSERYKIYTIYLWPIFNQKNKNTCNNFSSRRSIFSHSRYLYLFSHLFNVNQRILVFSSMRQKLPHIMKIATQNNKERQVFNFINIKRKQLNFEHEAWSMQCNQTKTKTKKKNARSKNWIHTQSKLCTTQVRYTLHTVLLLNKHNKLIIIYRWWTEERVCS